MDDSNLIYSQDKKRGFTKILTAIPLKTQHSPLFFTTNPQNRNTSIINMKVIQNHYHLMPYTSISLIPNQFQHIIPMHYQTLSHHSLDLSKPNLIYFFLNLSQKHHHSTLNTTNLTSIQENQGIRHEKHKNPTFPPLETYLFLGFSLASLP